MKDSYGINSVVRKDFENIELFFGFPWETVDMRMGMSIFIIGDMHLLFLQIVYPLLSNRSPTCFQYIVF